MLFHSAPLSILPKWIRYSKESNEKRKTRAVTLQVGIERARCFGALCLGSNRMSAR